MILNEGITEALSEVVNTEETSKLKQYMSDLGDWFVDKVFDIVLALIFIFIGTKLVKMVLKVVKKSFKRSGMDDSVAGFLISLIKIVLYCVVFITAASIVGFQVTSLVTILGTASLAIGLALQGSLSNFAGGVLILIMKPFKIGDYVEASGKEGTVSGIDIFYTRLTTADNKLIVIPNGNLMADAITNYTMQDVRRLDISIGIGYNSDIKLAKNILNDVAETSEYILKDKGITVFVDDFLDSSVKMGLRFYVKTDDYWSARWKINEQLKEEFDKQGIEIPFNHMEVTIRQTEK